MAKSVGKFLPCWPSSGPGVTRSRVKGLQLLLAMTLLVLVVPGSAAPLSASPLKLPSITATTVLSGTSGSRLVHLPADSTIDLKAVLQRESGPNPKISFSGSSPMITIAIKSAEAQPDDLPDFVAARFRTCTGAKCARGETGYANAIWTPGVERQPKLELEAGDYWIHFVSHGDSASVRLTMDGELEDRAAALKVQPRVSADLGRMEEQVHSRGNPTVYTAEGSFDLRSPSGFFLAATWFRTEEYRGDFSGECLRHGDRPLPGPLYQGPLCHGFSSTHFVTAPDTLRAVDGSSRAFYIFSLFTAAREGPLGPTEEAGGTHTFNSYLVAPGSMESYGSMGTMVSIR